MKKPGSKLPAAIRRPRLLIDQLDAAPGTRDCDVEPSVAGILRQRAEAVWQFSIGILSVADRENDRFALVALNGLEILHEEPLLPGRVEEGIQVGPALERSLAAGRCAVIHVDVDPVKHMWAPGLLHFKKMHEEPAGK